MKSKAFILSIFAYFLIAFSSYANMFDWNAKRSLMLALLHATVIKDLPI